MNNNLIGIISLVIIIVLAQSVVIVKDTEKALLLKLGAFERTLEPGLNFKIPLMDTALKFEGRLRTLDTQPDRVLSSESKPLLVDSFVKYKIVDAETFYTSTNGGQDRVAEDTLQRRVRDKLRNEFGKRTLQEVVSGDRDGLMLSLKESLGEDSNELGVEIVDFRVKRIDFEREIRASVFERMKTERNRIAEELSLNLDEPYINLVLISQNSTFIAKKAKTFEAEKKVAEKVPVDGIKIDNLGAEIKKKEQTNLVNFSYSIKIADFYYKDSAESMIKRIRNETNLKNPIIEKLSNTKYRVLLGPFNDIKKIEESFNEMKSLDFENLEILKNV